MKVIASNIFDFTTWYKFGYKFIPLDMIIDLADSNINSDELLHKTGFFEEEYEVFFLELPEINCKVTNKPLFLSLHDIASILPLTEKGGRLLSNKIPDFKISNAVSIEFLHKIIESRNRYLAINGGNRLIASFGIESNDLIIKFQEAFLKPLLNYYTDLNVEQDSMLDNILYYERSKPYPLTDMGFLFDVGGIAKARFNLNDLDFKNKNQLKDTENQKYELVEEVIALSRFLQGENINVPWSEFLKEYSVSDLLKKLNSDLSLVETREDINNLLVIALYLKFRSMIRNTTNIDDNQFNNTISQFLTNIPTETTIALYLVGMFFGSLKYKELYYKNVPLKISRHKHHTFPKYSLDKNNSKKLEKKDVIFQSEANHEVSKSIDLKSQDSNNVNCLPTASTTTTILDASFWPFINSRVSKFSNEQQKKIKECFSSAINEPLQALDNRSDLFINKLKIKMKNQTTKISEKQLNSEILNEVQLILSEYNLST